MILLLDKSEEVIFWPNDLCKVVEFGFIFIYSLCVFSTPNMTTQEYFANEKKNFLSRKFGKEILGFLQERFF